MDMPSLFDSLPPIGLDTNEAPAGFYAVLKSSVPQDQGNLCRFCDARPLCVANEDGWTLKNRCMSDVVLVTQWGGRELRRRDGQSVLYKRRPTPEAPK